MQSYIHSGYYHLFRPPYSMSTEYHRSTMYCVSDRFNSLLVIIPLVPGFYKAAIDLVKQHPARKIYLIAPDIGLPFVSDYYLTWEAITKGIRKSCKIFTKYMVENFARSDFIADIIRTENDNISFEVYRSATDVGTIDITLSIDYCSTASPFACDVILNDTNKKILFVSEINDHKAKYLSDNPDLYDEIHMAYITGNYGGYTYAQMIKEYPKMRPKIYCNQFASNEEFKYATSKKIQIGGVFNNDFI